MAAFDTNYASRNTDGIPSKVATYLNFVPTSHLRSAVAATRSSSTPWCDPYEASYTQGRVNACSIAIRSPAWSPPTRGSECSGGTQEAALSIAAAVKEAEVDELTFVIDA